MSFDSINIYEILITLPLLLIALSIHEFAHAWVADKLGDSTPRSQGRVTLNPIKHLDPMGTGLLVFSMLFTNFAFGWGKPVMVNPNNFKNPNSDYGKVAFAGPLSNIIMAFASFLIIKFVEMPSFVEQGFFSFLILNIFLAVFNLIPIFPLDGFNITKSLLKGNLKHQFEQTAQYGQYFLILIIATGQIGTLTRPIIKLVYKYL